ncbi:oligosaccharide flippase family protein [Halobacteriaceae archaeon GCM10025711]
MGDSSGASTLARQGGVTFVGNIIGKALGFAFVVVITRFVSPTTYGTFTLALSIISLTQGLSSLSIHRSIDFFVPQSLSNDEPGKAKEILRSVTIIGLLGSSIGTAVLLFSAPWLTSLFKDPSLVTALPLLALTLPLTTLNQIFLASFNSIKKLKFRVYTKNLINPIGKLIIAVALVLILGNDLLGLTGGYLIALAITVLSGGTFLLMNASWVRHTHAEAVDGRQLVSYSFPLLFAGLIYAVVGQIDYFFIGYFRTSPDVAKYKVSYLLASNLLIVLSAVTPVFKPMVSEARAQHSVLAERFKLSTRWVTMLTIPIAVTLMLAPGTYLSLFFTADYAAANIVVVVLVAGYLANASFGPEGMMLEGLGHTRLTLLNTILLIAVNITLDALLIPRIGILGAAIGTGAGLAVAGAAGVLELYYLRKLHPYSRRLAIVWIAAIPAVLAGMGLLLFLDASLAQALTLPVVVSVIYLLAVVILGGTTEEDRHVLRNIWSNT